jgi:hypothetical protein
MKIFLRVLTLLLVVALSYGHWQFFRGLPQLQSASSSIQSVSVEPLPLQVYCPGALVEVGGESGVEIGTVARIGEALISSYVGASTVLVPPAISSVAGSKAEVGDSAQSTDILSLVQSQVVDRERAQGLAATYCQKPLASGWLINGSSVVGSESVLIAANPAAVEALISLEIHLPGRVITDRFALAPGEEQLIPTAGYANGESAFAIYFESSGPEISMALQNRETLGLNPVGIEIEGVTLNPSTEFVFAGLRPLTQGFENPTARVYNPTSEVAEVVITVFGEENVELFRQLVNPGSFGEIELEILGEYQLATLNSDQPVLAAIRNPSTTPVLDFAWIQPAELFSSVTVALTSYQNSVLVANPGSSTLEITLEARFGERLSVQTLVVPAFSQVEVPLSGTSVKIAGSGEFAVALEIFDPSGYSVVHPRQSANLGNDLEIEIN